VKLESWTEDKELVAAAIFAAYKEEVDAIITLAANDEEKYDDAIALVANKYHVNVGLTKKTNVYKLINESPQIVKAAKTRKNTLSKLIIDDWGYVIEIIKTDVVRGTDEVTTDTRSEEFNNRKQNADDNIPQRVQSHLQPPKTSAPSPKGLSWRCTRT
jgi:hypothetical protein